ncbi:hypothetical protein CAPTEDRAFT_204492 [Capitella teleta]|uniref:Uncharacterized protein n=1 Tax=Capitella teleta TaxID=283909 RepID=R7TCV8_CAPTE|nr:hypothetical protein CAPTEDRAFT_204492 [Capitella teleta]|eukprot:ELT91588.1 hypothetical protein CAPTEDRAFT_204492 [Capitella teleta]
MSQTERTPILNSGHFQPPAYGGEPPPSYDEGALGPPPEYPGNPSGSQNVLVVRSSFRLADSLAPRGPVLMYSREYHGAALPSDRTVPEAMDEIEGYIGTTFETMVIPPPPCGEPEPRCYVPSENFPNARCLLRVNQRIDGVNKSVRFLFVCNFCLLAVLAHLIYSGHMAITTYQDNPVEGNTLF